MRWVLSLVLVALLAGPVFAKSREPIRIAEGVTTTQKVAAAIAARALKKSGFRPDLTAVQKVSVVEALMTGTVHVHVAVSAPDQPRLQSKIAAKAVRSLGGLARNAPDEASMKIVWPGMKSRWPYAQKMLKRMVIPPHVLEGLVAEVKAGKPVKVAVRDWWKTNAPTWRPWIAASTNWMKP